MIGPRSGIAVSFKVHFEQSNTLPEEKIPFPEWFATRVQMGQFAALYCRVSTADQTCARQERDLRAFSKKAGYKIASVWKETASGAKDDRAARKEVLALAQAREIDVILVTEPTRWGRSMLDLFTLQELQAWNVSLVAQTGLQFDLGSAPGKLIGSLMAALANLNEIYRVNGCARASRPRRSAVSFSAGGQVSD